MHEAIALALDLAFCQMKAFLGKIGNRNTV